jgi:hypothetical protein
VPTERDRHGAGERGQVDDRLGLEATRVHERVGQQQSALGVGVGDLDRGPVHGADHVARLERLAADHVLRTRDEADEAERQVERGERGEHADHRRRTAHVVLHLVHLLARLERHATGVERDALADEHHRGHRATALAGRILDELDEARRVGAAATDGERAAHAQALHGRHVVDRGARPDAMRDLDRALGERGRRKILPRRAGEVASEPHRLTARDAGGEGALERRRRDLAHQHLDALQRGLATRGEVSGVTMVAQHHTLAHGAQTPGIASGVAERQRERARGQFAGATRGGGGGEQHAALGQIARATQAHEQHAPGLHAGQPQERGLAGTAGEVAARDRRLHDTATCAIHA